MIDLYSKRLLKNAGRNGPTVLMYHSIQTGVRKASWRWATSLRDFRAHLDLLQSSGWQSHNVQQLVGVDALPDRTAVITFDDGYTDNLVAVEELVKRGMTATFFIVTNDLGKNSSWPETDIAPQRLLAPADLREMKKAGMEIGSHSRSHVDLTCIAKHELTNQIQGSRIDLEQSLGDPVLSFSYPFGRWDSDATRIVENAGYTAACGTNPGVYRKSERFTIRRLSLFNQDTPSRLARKLAFSDNRCDWYFVAKYYSTRLRARARSRVLP
jgi:peptidoglycan/xylan/chitin deacetylase (PgdA/CDA1 family)